MSAQVGNSDNNAAGVAQHALCTLVGSARTHTPQALCVSCMGAACVLLVPHFFFALYVAAFCACERKLDRDSIQNSLRQAGFPQSHGQAVWLFAALVVYNKPFLVQTALPVPAKCRPLARGIWDKLPHQERREQ